MIATQQQLGVKDMKVVMTYAHADDKTLEEHIRLQWSRAADESKIEKEKKVEKPELAVVGCSEGGSKKSSVQSKGYFIMAEREGFEPPVELPPLRFSKPMH